MGAENSAIWKRLAAFSPGDLVEAAELQELLEAHIVSDESDFNEAARLSKLLDEFQTLVREGVGADWDQFRRQWGLANEPEVEPAAEAPARVESDAETVEVDVEVLQSFLTEAAEHLETVEDRTLKLEAGADPKVVNEIFRAVHTVKGVAGFLNFTKIKTVAHELESLLDELRSGARAVDRSLVDLVLLGTDTLGQLVGLVADAAARLGIDKGSASLTYRVSDISPVIEALQRLRTGAPSEPRAPEPVPSPTNEALDLLQSPELVGKFSQEALEALEIVETCVLTMEKTRSTGDYLNEAFRSIHTLKGNAGFFGFSALEALCMDMESFLDALRKGSRAVDSEATEILLGLLDRLRSLVSQGGASTLRPAPAPVVAQAVPAPSAAPSAPRPSVEAPVEAKGDEPYGKYTVKKKDIRVDTEKLDALFDLIGELITAEAMVIDNPELRNLELESFSRAATYLSKITRELQSVTMSIRMIPLEGLFSKMNRLVRDLGRKFSKAIDLEISGAETEMDRNIIEEISDPLVHIIRNAIDHGIEDDQRRLAKGKKPGGKIRLDARYEGNEIWITVSDDGAGLNRDRILEVARSKGLIADDAQPADADVWKLIFEPGFSTAKQVSEISGRGVGMDVVKKNLEKLRGQIDIQTVVDQGTDFVLRIPLTLAIIDGVTLRSGATLYSLPIGDVVEFQNFQSDHLTWTDPKHAVLRLRNEVLPVVTLAELFVTQGNAAAAPSAKQVSIIVKSQNRKMALIVDEIVGYKQIVLKALPESMVGLEGVSGCTILGNGEVSLIIDVNALFRRCLV